MTPRAETLTAFIFEAANERGDKYENSGLIKCFYDAGAFFDKGGDGEQYVIIHVNTDYLDATSSWILTVTAIPQGFKVYD